MIKKIREKMKLYMTPLHYLRGCCFFLNILFVITLYYIYDLNQNLNQISSDWLNESLTFHAFVICFYGLIFFFEMWFFLWKIQSLEENSYALFAEIIFWSFVFLIPTALIFGLISGNLSLKKDLLFPEIFNISEVLRIMPKEEAEKIFWESTHKFPTLMFEINPKNFRAISAGFSAMAQLEEYKEVFEKIYALAPTKEKFLANHEHYLKSFWEALDVFVEASKEDLAKNSSKKN